MHRFYCPSLSINAALSAVYLDPSQTRHARTVLRLTIGDEVALFNGNGLTANATIQSDQKQMALCVIQVQQAAPLRPAIDLAVCIPKGPRASAMADQLSQLGVSRLIPLLTVRSVVNPGAGKIQRLRTGAIESAKQCGRAHVMTIDEPANFKDVIGRDYALKIIADPTGGTGGKGEAGGGDESPHQKTDDDKLIMIGPEGGFTDPELDQARQAGFEPWAIAPYILRIETAAIAAAAILRYGAI